MSGKDNMKRFLDHMNNDVDKLKAIVRIRQADNALTNIITSSETEALEETTVEIFSPTKINEQGEEVKDIDRFMSMMNAFADIQLQSELKSGREAAQWKAYLDKKQPESYVTYKGKTYEVNTELAKAHASRTAYTIHVDSAVSNMVMMGGKGLNDKICEYWNEAVAQDEALKKRFEDVTGLKPEEHQEPDDFEYLNAILTFARIDRLEKMSEKDKQLIACGVQVNKFNSAVDDLKLKNPDKALMALQRKKALEMPFAWTGAKEKLEVLTQAGNVPEVKNVLKNDQAELLRTAKETIGLFNVMENNYKSLLYNTDSYNHMKTAAKNLKAKYKAFGLENADFTKVALTKDQKNELAELLDQVAVMSGRYVKDHAERRGSETGKGRFETAMAMLGTISYSAATEVAKEVNKIREKSTKEDKQMVNLDALLTERQVHPGIEYRINENARIYTEVKSENVTEAENKLVSALQRAHFEDAKTAMSGEKPEIKQEKTERSKLSFDGLMEEIKGTAKKVEAPKKLSKFSRQMEEVKNKKKEELEKVKDKYLLK